MTHSQRFFSAISALSILLIGCGIVHNAREAQDAVLLDAVGITNGVRSAIVFPHEAKLPDFILFAYTNRPDMVQAELNVQKAAIAVKIAKAEDYPNVSVGGGYSQSTANGGSHFSWHNSGRAHGNASLDWTLLDFGRIDASVRSAQEELFAAEANLHRMRNSVFTEVATAYFTLLCNDALFEVAKTNEFQYAEHLRQSELLLEAEETKKLDVLRARLDLSQAKLDTLNASNDVVTSAAAFFKSLGLSVTDTERSYVIPPRSNALDRCMVEIDETSLTAACVFERARYEAPSIVESRAKLRAASSDVDYAIADLMPRVSLSTAFNFTDPAWNWTWGFSAVQSLFEGFRKTSAVDFAVANMLDAREDLVLAEQQLSHDLELAVAARDLAKDSLLTASVQVRQAKENLDTVEAEFKVGEASRIEYTDSVGAWARALGSRVKAFYQGQISEAELTGLSGVDPVYAERVVEMKEL